MYNNTSIKSIKVQSPEDLPFLRRKVNCENIEVDFDEFSRGNWPMYLFRYVVWALAHGAEASVVASDTISSTGIVPFRWSFRMVMQIAAKSIYPEGIISSFDESRRTFKIKRIAHITSHKSWTAIIVFSGEKNELKSLEKCLESLRKQSEILNGGEIIVCGPSNARELTSDFNDIKYLSFDNELKAGRFLISKKKNYAINAAKNENILVCHTRIMLRDDALKNIPNEFDCITPRIEIKSAKGNFIPYLDLCFVGKNSTSSYTESISPRIFYDRKKWWKFLSKYYAYADGAIFCVKRNTALQVPLNEAIAWGEGEDVEWCVRLQNSGRVVELAENSYAESQKNRHLKYAKFGEEKIFLLLTYIHYYTFFLAKSLGYIVKLVILNILKYIKKLKNNK
jgi:hypothetical protein